MSEIAVKENRENRSPDTGRKGNAVRTILWILSAVITCCQAVFLFRTVCPQMYDFQDIGLLEAMFAASEVTVFAFELFYLFLSGYGLLKNTVSSRVDRAKGITFFFFALLLVVQTVSNTFFTALEGGFRCFLAGKNLCTLVLFALNEIVRHRAGDTGTATNAKNGKTVAGMALRIFVLFYSVYVFFTYYPDYPFITPVGYVHLFLCLACAAVFAVGALEKKAGFLKKLMRGLCIFLVIMTVLFSVILIPMIFSQHHRILAADCTVDQLDEVLQNAEMSDRNVIVCENEDVYVYFPLYEDIRFAAGDLPSKADEQNIMVIPAPFTHAYALDFSHDNVEGIHVDAGILYEGSHTEGRGAFTYADGQAALWNDGEAEDALNAAAAQGGCGYQQYLVLENGERTDFTMGPRTCYRALARWKDRICIIDSRQRMYYPEFLVLLEELGIEDAIYCDMGTGWNYSWYRTDAGNAKNLFGLPWPFSTSWLVFRK